MRLDGGITSDREFCIGQQLSFMCSLALSAYEWILPPFLNGTVENGRVVINETGRIGEFTLSAKGTGFERTSSLNVSVFEELVGERVVTCREASAGPSSVNQSVTITVLSNYCYFICFILNFYITAQCCVIIIQELH